MRKIIIITSVLILAVAVMAIKYFSSLSSQNNNAATALQHIPNDAAIILNFNNDDSFYEIFKEYELFGAIIGTERAVEINQLQQILLRHVELKEATSDKNIFISFHPNATDSVDFLYTINLNEQIDQDDIDEALTSNPEISAQKDNNSGIYTLHLKSLHKPFFIYFEKGAATGSFSAELLLKSINKDLPKADEGFVNEIIKSSVQNHNSPVNIYINHSRIPGFISKYIKGKVNGTLSLLTHIKGISLLNMNFKSDALMFNGISKTDTSDLGYVNLYINQKPVKNDLKKIFPENLAYFISFGISNRPAFNQKLKSLFNKRKELPRLQGQMDLIQKQTGVILDNEILPSFAEEFAVMESPNHEKLAIIKLKNGRDAKFKLDLISTPAASEVSRLNHSNIFYYYFGDPLKQFVRPYFSVVDNFLIIANSNSLIQGYLSNYNDGKFLIITPDFSDYNQYVGNQSNIFYFINNKKADRLIASTLKKKYAAAFKNDHYGLKDFYGFSYQWTADDGHFFTNIYISYKSTATYQLTEAWKTELGARLAIQPQLLDFNGQKLILLQDRSEKLHAVTTAGKIQWSKQLEGKVKGSLQKTNQNEIMFCTSKKLYKLTLGGELTVDFPKNLPFPSSGGAVYMNDKIYIPTGNSILAFDKDGNRLSNWNRTLDGKILGDLKTMNLGEDHLVIAATENGAFYVYDENGDLLHKTKDQDNTQYKNPIFIEKGSSFDDSRIVTADTSGTVTYVTLKGQITKKKFPDIQSPDAFDFVNIAGDEYPEHIFLDKKRITVIAKDGYPAWIYNFTSTKKRKTVSYRLNNYTSQYGVISEDNELLLFKDDGSPMKGFPLQGGDFHLLSPLNNGSLYLISNKGSTLIAYRL